ncbi:hypothetical protein ILYODFUR_029650 [Ilyodon furcidens]|uniref:Neurotransmitter-gated ion-channel ligand-binding domain-containing protein n=1 Tax=Ilyodon furcidens TaxID=33524 RepID=A0ABV0U302_9TELE
MVRCGSCEAGGRCGRETHGWSDRELFPTLDKQDSRNWSLEIPGSAQGEQARYSIRAGVTNVRFPDHLIWKPDILLYNSADERFDATFHTNILVNSSGSCSYLPPGKNFNLSFLYDRKKQIFTQ